MLENSSIETIRKTDVFGSEVSEKEKDIIKQRVELQQKQVTNLKEHTKDRTNMSGQERLTREQRDDPSLTHPHPHTHTKSGRSGEERETVKQKEQEVYKKEQSERTDGS